MTKLCMNGFQQRGDDRKVEESKSQLLALDSSNPKPADNPGGSRTLHTSRVSAFSGGTSHKFFFAPPSLNLIFIFFACSSSQTPLSLCLRCRWQRASWANPADCWCQTWRCSLTCVTSARLFSLDTQPPEESSYDISTPTSLRLTRLVSGSTVMEL